MAKNKKKTNAKKAAVKEPELDTTVENPPSTDISDGEISDDKAISDGSHIADGGENEEPEVESKNSDLQDTIDKQKLKIEELLKKLSVKDHQDNESKGVAAGTHVDDNSLKDRLEAAITAKEEAEENYQTLLGRISHIKSTLGERLKSDAAEIEEYQQKVEDLEKTIASLNSSVEELQRETITTTRENDQLSHELSKLRSDFQKSQASWSEERDSLMQERKKAIDQLEKAQVLLQNMELAVAEDKSIQEDVNIKVADLEEQVSTQSRYAERFRQERESLQKLHQQSQKEWFSEKESLEKQIQALTDDNDNLLSKLTSTQQMHLEATNKIDELEATIARLKPFEGEIKEKNLLIGKLRHEAVILNEHLTKALKLIKKDSEGHTCDKQLISNLIISFVQIPRGDTKKFEVLQLIADYLGWDDDQKFQAGLTRSGQGSATPSKRGSIDESSTSGGFMGLFAEFLEREASKKPAQ